MSERKTISSRIAWSSAVVFSWLVYGFIFAPIIIVIILAFNSSEFGSFPFSGFSFRWFREFWEDDRIMEALQTSLLLGASTALISVVVGFLAAIALVRYRVRGSKLVGTLVTLPILVPETVLALGLLILMRAADLPRSYYVLLAGHVLLTLPFAVLVLRSRLTSMSKIYEEAAGSLGASSMAIFREVTLPLCMPAVIAAFVFTFTMSFDNLTATLFWMPAGMTTLPVQILAMLRDSMSPQINALATGMIVLTIGLSLVGATLGNRRKA